MSDNSFYDEGLKLAYLWFDDVVLQSPLEDTVTGVLPRIFEKLSVPTGVIQQLLKNVHPIQAYFPDYKFAQLNVWDNDSHVTTATLKALKEYFEEEYGKPKNPHALWALNREVGLTSLGVIDAINLVGRLSARAESFLLPTDFEHRALQEIMKPAGPGATFNLFEEVAQFRLPRLKELPWNRVAELRHHRFLENFRRAISTMQKELREGSAKGASELFAELEKKQLKELLSLLTPSPLKATARGVLSNLPLPIPVNPAGLLDAIQSVVQQRHIADKFGWIYFLYDVDT